MDKEKSKILNLDYIDKEENWKEKYPFIMQAIKNELLKKLNSKVKIILFENLSLNLLKEQFLDLLIMFENHYSNKYHFIILEDKTENLEYIKKKYSYIKFHQIQEIDPEMYKNLVINLILQSKLNTLSDV